MYTIARQNSKDLPSIDTFNAQHADIQIDKPLFVLNKHFLKLESIAFQEEKDIKNPCYFSKSNKDVSKTDVHHERT